MIHFLVSGLLAAAMSFLPSWKEGTLDIHMIASAYGENTFVVMPDGTTMLIDAGDPKAEVVTEYIRHFSPRPSGLDYFLLTHFHKDHIGGAEAAADSVWRAVSVFGATDEIHSMMILKDGKKIYERYDTGHRPDERHVMWSASKTFTAIAVGFAVQESLFGIDDKVISFFLDDELPSERGEWLEKLRIRDLLTMSSGLGTDGINMVRSLEWKHPAKEVFAVPMAFAPGSRYHYNSMNTYLLSEIVQRCTGMKLSEYLNIRLFRPLGICNWEWEESADGVTAGGWGIYTTTETLAKTAQLNKGKRNFMDLIWKTIWSRL